MQKCKFIMEHLRITQGYGRDANGNVDNSSYSHKGSYALDLGGKDTGINTAFAPCDVVVKRIYGTYNAVWFETLEEVMCADGQARKLVFMLLHCNSADIKALGIKAGKTFKQGEPFYKEGTAGNVTGAHIHLEVGEAPFTGTGWHKSTANVWIINNQLIPHKIFFLSEDTVVMNDGGYDWITEKTVEPLSDHSARLKIGRASSGDIKTIVNMIEEIGGIETEVKDSYIYTSKVSAGDQITIISKCDELKIGCVIYEEPAEEPTTEENSVTYLVGPISKENQAEFEAECQKLGVPFEVCEEIADETPEIEEIPEPEKTTIEAADEPKQLYIGPMSGGDRATLFNMAAELLLKIDDGEERYLTIGPASKGDQAAIIAKCEELQIPCYFYEVPTDVEEPEREEPVGEADKLPADELTFDEIDEIISSAEKNPAEQPEADGTQEPEPEKPEADKEPAKDENGENEANTSAGAEDTNVPGKDAADTNVGDIGINEDTYQPGMWEDLPPLEPEEKKLLGKVLDWLVNLIKKLLG